MENKNEIIEAEYREIDSCTLPEITAEIKYITESMNRTLLIGIIEIGKRFEKIGYKIFATKGTAEALTEAGVKAIAVNKIEQSTPNLMDLILGHKIDLVIDTPPQGAEHSKDGFVIRRSAIETGVNVLTAIDTAKALITSLENTDIQKLTLVDIVKIQAV